MKNHYKLLIILLSVFGTQYVVAMSGFMASARAAHTRFVHIVSCSAAKEAFKIRQLKCSQSMKQSFDTVKNFTHGNFGAFCQTCKNFTKNKSQMYATFHVLKDGYNGAMAIANLYPKASGALVGATGMYGYGALTDYRDQKGFKNILEQAINTNDLRALRELVVENRSNYVYEDALCKAAEHGSFDKFNLLSSKIDNADEIMPYAIRGGNLKIIDYLIFKNASHQKALECAKQSKNSQIISFVLQKEYPTLQPYQADILAEFHKDPGMSRLFKHPAAQGIPGMYINYRWW